MKVELGDRERRYLAAYLELESHAVATPVGAREHVLEEALAELELDAGASARRQRGLVMAGVGLCVAAAALAWWIGRSSLLERHATQVPDQAPLMREQRPVHATSASRRAAGTATVRDAEAGSASPHADDLGSSASKDAADLERSRSRAEPAARRRAPSEPSEPLPTLADAEVALLERAREQAKQGAHAAALETLREHARRYPGSVLDTERTAERVAVLCRMGAATAPAARTSFLAGDPPQYLRSRVEKACTP